MSWPTWSASAAPIPTTGVAAPPIQSTLLPTSVNPAPSVHATGVQYSPEQWAQAQQQNWQQWAQWQQQYQQWHQQYGAEVITYNVFCFNVVNFLMFDTFNLKS